MVRDIAGPLSRTTQRDQYVLVITDRYSNLTRAVPATKTSKTHNAVIFLKHWIVPFGTPRYVLAGDGPKFVSKIFATICEYLEVKHLKTIAYHPQTNEKVDLYKKTIVTRLRHYIADDQPD